MTTTTTEARDALVANDPTKTYCVSEEQWYHRAGQSMRTKYIISFQPGLAEECTSLEGQDLELLLKEIIFSINSANALS